MPLAAANVPVLALRAPRIECGYLNSDVRRQMGLTAEPKDICALPVSFRILQLHTARLTVDVAQCSGGAVLKSRAEVQNVVPVEELCRFLGLAPRCYKEFQLYAGGEDPMLSIEAWWFVGEGMGTKKKKYNSLQALASVMQQFAGHHKLAVSQSDDAMYLRVIRMRPSG